MVILAPTQQGICLNPAVQDTCAFYSAGICKFPKDCSFSHKKVEDMISLKKEMSEMKTKYSSAIKTVEKQGKIINVLREQVNNLQGEVLNIMRT